MKRYQVLLIGPTLTGKTEFCLRMIGSQGTSVESTTYFNIFSSSLINPSEDPEEQNIKDLERLLIKNDEAIVQLWDFAGQMQYSDVEPFLNGFIGAIYIVNSENPDIEYFKEKHALIRESLGKNLPAIIYVSKSLTDSSKINLKEVIQGYEQSIELFKELSNYCEAPLIIGDSIGRGEQIKPVAYLINSKDDDDEHNPRINFRSIPSFLIAKSLGPRAFRKDVRRTFREYGIF